MQTGDEFEMCIGLGSDAGRNFLSTEDPVKKKSARKVPDAAPEVRPTFLVRLGELLFSKVDANK
jgi:hypothetical protein